jgi:hypothetical protein
MVFYCQLIAQLRNYQLNIVGIVRNLGEYFSRGKNLRVTDVLSSSRGSDRELEFTKIHTLRKHFW